MRTHMARLSSSIAVLIMVAASACDIGSALFTDEELDSMYEIGLSQAGDPLGTGARVAGATPIVISVSSIDGAPEAVALDLLLLDAGGAEAASIRYTVVDSPDAIRVDTIASGMPPFTLPKGLAEGYYRLEISIRDAAGEILSSYSEAILIFSGTIPQPRLAVYPGAVVAGGVSLLRLEGQSAEGIDPWVRWTVDGTRQAEGFASSLADRFTWRAPAANGVYIARAELFPFKPPVEADVPALAKAEIRLPISASSPPADPFAGVESWSIMQFGGDFADTGPRPRSIEPEAIGKPYLDTYAAGFGYLMGNGTGAFSPSSLLPVSGTDGRVAPFTAVFSIAPAPSGVKPAGGPLLTALAGEGRLVIGIDAGYPFVATGGTRATASDALPSGASRLAVSMTPSIGGAVVTFYIDERLAGSTTVPAAVFEGKPGACTIAGEGGFVAIYDELRIIAGPYPAFHIAEATRNGTSLIAASGFEGGALGPGLEPDGGYSLADGRLVLEPGSSLAVGSPGLPAAGASLSFEVLSGAAEASLVLDGGSVLSVSPAGTVRLDGKPVGIGLAMGSGPAFNIAVEATRDGIRLYGAGDDSILVNAAPAGDARWLVHAPGPGPAVVTRVSASAFTMPLSSAGGGGTGAADVAAASPGLAGGLAGGQARVIAAAGMADGDR